MQLYLPVPARSRLPPARRATLSASAPDARRHHRAPPPDTDDEDEDDDLDVEDDPVTPAGGAGPEWDGMDLDMDL